MKQKKQRPTIVNKFTFNAPIGRFYEYIENYYGDNRDDSDDDDDDDATIPTIEELKKAILCTKKNGLWWSNRSWGVSFRVYQLVGYKGSYSDYVELVNDAKIDTGYECNYDAVQKMASSAKLIGKPDTWEYNGASAQTAILGKALLKLLRPEKTSEREIFSG